jgi:putative addiction module component (TIGR02574 family)
MSSLVDDITLKARSLPAEDRARLAEELLSSLQTEENEAPEIEAAWDEEIRRRLDEIDAGTAKLIPAAQAFAEVRRMLK